MSNLVPEGWEMKVLGDCYSRFSSGMTPSRSHPEYFMGTIPWVTSGELNYNRIFCTKENITEEAVKKTNLKLYPKDTFFIAITGLEAAGTRGRCAILGVDAAVNQSCMAFEPIDAVDTNFLFHYYMHNGQKFAFTYAQGTKQQSFNASIVKSLPLLLPSLPEQKKIAAILTSVDDVIEKTQAQIDKLKDLKTGMMQELLTRGVGVDGKPHTEFKDSPVGRIPKGWEVKSIGDLFQVQLGKMLSKKSKVGDCPLPYLGNKNVQWGKFDLTNIETMDFSEKEISKFSLKRGDLLMCEGGDVGRCAIWNNEIGNCYYQKALHRLRPINNEYDSFLLMEYMKFAKQNGALVDYISQTSIAHLTKEKLVSIPVPVPPREEQRKIVSALKAVTLKLQTGQKKLDKTGVLKKALMQDLLTGKVRVKVDS